jgi:hypothetical protein
MAKRCSKRRSLRTHRRTRNKRGGMSLFGARGAGNLEGAHLRGGGGIHEILHNLGGGGVGGLGGVGCRKRMTRTRRRTRRGGWGVEAGGGGGRF